MQNSKKCQRLKRCEYNATIEHTKPQKKQNADKYKSQLLSEINSCLALNCANIWDQCCENFVNIIAAVKIKQ